MWHPTPTPTDTRPHPNKRINQQSYLSFGMSAPAVPAKDPRPTQQTMHLVLTQDMFDEISKLVPPIAAAMALETKVEDQHIKQKMLLVGEQEVATVTDLKIEKFSMDKMAMPLRDGYLDVSIHGITVNVSCNAKAVGVSLGKVIVDLKMDLTAIVKLFDGKNGVLKVEVEQVTPAVTFFDTQIGTGFGGDILESVTDLFNSTVKKTIADTIIKPVDDALTQGLDSVLGRPLSIEGQVSAVGYRFDVAFLGNPIIKPEGCTMNLAVDTTIKVSKPLPPAPVA
ncbi:hypothetical protein BJ742DRAFT_816662 [Cladochytrium replicatum]|nr:hypothetical protein BJ742DRAFT_816662 [Cladochytrium replicatum]